MKNYLNYLNGLLFSHLISYFLGSIPFGFILTKIFIKKDIRDIGSGNIGATNALRTGNKLIGYSTLILDVTKAVLPVIYKIKLSKFSIYFSIMCFSWSPFPIWLKFKGGKGVATYVECYYFKFYFRIFLV